MVGLTADRDLTLAHRFQQCRLYLRGSTIDLIRQQQVVKDRPLVKAEGALLRTVDLGAGQVCREQA